MSSPSARTAKYLAVPAFLALAGCHPANPNVAVSNGGSMATINKQITTTGGANVKLGFDTAINPDCTNVEKPAPQILQQPEHGQLTITHVSDFAFFPPANPRSACNAKKVMGYTVAYHAARGYVGQDHFAYATYTSTGGAFQVVVTANDQ